MLLIGTQMFKVKNLRYFQGYHTILCGKIMDTRQDLHGIHNNGSH